MKSRILIPAIIGGLLSGCGHRDKDVLWIYDPPRSAVLFQARPAFVSPQNFAYRAEWPASFRDRNSGEIEVYDIYTVDRQLGYGQGSGHHGFGTDDHYRRTFRSRRSGLSFR